MNEHAEAEAVPVEAPETGRDVAGSVEAERSAFAVHRDPSLAPSGAQSRVGRGITWVRPSDLIASSTARLAGRGIDFQAELAHHVRSIPGETYRATRNRARDARDRRAARVVSESVFESFDVFEPQDRPRSSSSVRPSGIGLG